MKSCVGLLMSNLNSKQIMKTTESSSNPKLQSWILDFLSKPNKVFDNLPPCPYAKKAWLDGRVGVKKFEGFESFDNDLVNWNDEKEVIIYEFEDTPGSYTHLTLPTTLSV